MKSNSQTKYFWAYLAVFLGVCGHASSEFVSVFSGVSGPEVSVWRYLLGGLGLVLWALVLPQSRDLLTPLRHDGMRIVLLSVGGVTFTYLAFHWALDFASVIQVATLITTMPIFVGIANLAVNRMPVSAAKIMSGICAAAGVALLLTDGALARLAGSEDSVIGLGLALATTVLGATYAVLVKPVIVQYGALRVTALSMMIGGIGLWLLVGTAWGIWVDPTTLFDRPDREAYSLLTIALWNTTITQLLWFGGLAAVPDITRGSYLFFLKPVIAAALALTLLGQPITPIQVLAIIVICGSVVVELNWPRVSALFSRQGS